MSCVETSSATQLDAAMTNFMGAKGMNKSCSLHHLVTSVKTGIVWQSSIGTERIA